MIVSRIGKPFLLGTALLWLTTAALAQAEAPVERSDKCQMQAPQDGPDKDGSNMDAQPQAGDDQSLTETLEGCGGVLEPPPVGDGEIAEPPPDEGETPVIRPGEVPEQ